LAQHSSAKPDIPGDEGQREPIGKPRQDDRPAGERRSRYRVGDDQQSGQGSLTALSKMKMLERKRNALKPPREEPLRIFD
jgi:hypothetical protein